MNKLRIFALVTICLTILNCKKTGDEEDNIKTIFKEFNLARVNKDGSKVYDLADNKSRVYYDSILKWSLTADKNKLEKLNLIDHLNVLSSRIVFSNSLKNMSSKDLMIKTFDKSSMNEAQQNAIRNVKLGPILLENENEASSTIDGIIPVKFIKENNEWKYNYMSFLKSTNKQIESLGLSDEEYINLFLNSPELLKYSENGFFMFFEIYSPIINKK